MFSWLFVALARFWRACSLACAWRASASAVARWLCRALGALRPLPPSVGRSVLCVARPSLRRLALRVRFRLACRAPFLLRLGGAPCGCPPFVGRCLLLLGVGFSLTLKKKIPLDKSAQKAYNKAGSTVCFHIIYAKAPAYGWGLFVCLKQNPCGKKSVFFTPSAP